MNNRRKIFFSILTICMLIATCCLQQQSTAQVITDQQRRIRCVVSQSKWVYEIIQEGTIHLNLKHSREFQTPIPLLAILTEPKIAEDLEIVGDQRKQLKAQMEALDDACHRAEQEYKVQLNDPDEFNQRELAILGILEPAIEKSIQTIRDLLLDKQADRLKQIAVQLEISRYGLVRFVGSRYGSEIGLTPKKKTQIRRRYLELAEAGARKIQLQKKQTIDLLLKAVSESDREQLTKAVGDEKNLYRAPLRILALQLDEKAISDFMKYRVESRWPKYAGITMPFSFEISSMGELVRVEPSEDPADFDELIPTRLLIYCLGNGELELVPEQIKAVQSLRSQQLQLWDSQTQAINAYIAANNVAFPPIEFRRQQEQQRIQFRDQIVPAIESILLPHQQAVLTEFAARTKFTLHGPIAAILNSESITTDEEDKNIIPSDTEKVPKNGKLSIWSRIENQGLKVLAEKEQRKITQLLIKLERETNRELIKELTPDQKKQFNTLIGKPLELERGNIEFHLALVQRPDELHALNQKPIWMEDVEVDPQKAKINDD